MKRQGNALLTQEYEYDQELERPHTILFLTSNRTTGSSYPGSMHETSERMGHHGTAEQTHKHMAIHLSSYALISAIIQHMSTFDIAQLKQFSLIKISFIYHSNIPGHDIYLFFITQRSHFDNTL